MWLYFTDKRWKRGWGGLHFRRSDWKYPACVFYVLKISTFVQKRAIDFQIPALPEALKRCVHYKFLKVQENKSLAQLENDYWKDTDFPSALVEKCHAFRKIPLNQLSIEQVRLLLGQGIGTVYLIPIALQFLTENILAEGDFYPGDLLSNVLDLLPEDWRGNEPARLQFLWVLNANKEEIASEGNGQLTRKVESYLQACMRKPAASPNGR